jgi:hypothetical protein
LLEVTGGEGLEGGKKAVVGEEVDPRVEGKRVKVEIRRGRVKRVQMVRVLGGVEFWISGGELGGGR